jgi:hypothetical protein
VSITRWQLPVSLLSAPKEPDLRPDRDSNARPSVRRPLSRHDLERGARAATSTQAYALRCRIVLACAEPGSFNTQVAAGLGVSVPTVMKWRGRFIDRGLPGLADEDRPGRPPSILLDKAGEVLAATLEQTPADHSVRNLSYNHPRTDVPG